MKICALIAEYNPFHLGHLKHIDYIRNTLKADKVVVIMSGNFTQRGDIAVLDKFTRAKHAVNAGADIVIELPTVFATASAEIFAKGAINIIHSLGVVDEICFGIESGKKEEYIELAKALNDESKEFKKALKEHLDKGVSLAKAKFLAVKDAYGKDFNEELINSPNNVLGLEYTKALLSLNSGIEICPMIRGGDHNDKTLKKGITSATSIREILKTGKIKKLKKNLPPFVFKDLREYPFDFEKICLSALIKESAENIAKILDCTEGLENRIKALSKDNLDLEGLIEKVSTKRYTKTRIRRILTSNLLGITEKLVFLCLSSPLYAKVLAVKESEKDLISVLNHNSSIPLLMRKSDTDKLKKTAKSCFEKDTLACELYSLITNTKLNENNVVIVE